MHDLLQETLSTYRFTSIADWLRMAPEESVAPGDRPRASSGTLAHRDAGAARARSRTLQRPIPVTLVVPCFNEENGLAYLRNTLQSVEKRLGDRFDFRFVFVDDCSTDNTYAGLQETFGDRANCKVVRHEVNSGVAAAIMTGIKACRHRDRRVDRCRLQLRPA